MTNPNDAPLQWFASQMLKKLSLPKNVFKTHWRHLHYHQLIKRLKQEVDELVAATNPLELGNGDADAVISECCDVANFALFIADKARRGEKPTP